MELEDNLYQFEKEFRLIDEIKCHLINYGDLDDFEYEDVYIIRQGNTYDIHYDNYCIELETKGGQIYDYSFN